MDTKTHNRFSRKRIIIALIPIAILVLAVFFVYILNLYHYNKQKEADLEQLTSSNYNGIFCSMYSIEHFSQEDFTTYRGINTLKLKTSLRNTADLGEYLSIAFASGNTIDTVYLGLDPIQICSGRSEQWNASLNEDIISHAVSHPDITFEILLSSPSLEYWCANSAEETEEILSNYLSFIGTVNQYSNIIVFFPGAEQWLIANTDNYSDHMEFNPIVAQHLMLSTFCDRNYVVTTEEAPALLDGLKELIDREKTTPTEYPNLSSWDIVFFGDSIIGNYTGSYSVPGVVTGLSGAKTYNCAQGGIPACVTPALDLSFPSSADYIIEGTTPPASVEDPFQSSLAEYINTDHSGQNLCFVLNFGLNDYFGGHPVANEADPYDVTTYAGALRVGISKLQTAYPDATILLMTPTPTFLFENGTQPLSEKGGVLTEYVDAALQVAEETNVLYLNNYIDLGINENNESDYLADGTHLNPTGRFLLAQHIIWKIGSSLSQ